MTVLGPQPFDQPGGGAARLGELLADPLAERRGKGVHLPDRWLALLLHRVYQSSGLLTQVCQLCAKNPGWRAVEVRYLQREKEISELDKTSLVIDRAKIDEARKILGTKTLAATVDAALDEVLRLEKRRRVMDRIRKHGGLGPDLAELRRLRTR